MPHYLNELSRRHSRVTIGILRAFLSASLSGLGVASWVHISALAGQDPGSEIRGVWVVQLLLFALLIPIILELFLTKDYSQILRAPRWMQRILYALLVYYGLNFYGFLYWSVENLDSRVTWRMFSSGWLLLFGLASAFYRVRLLESGQSSSYRVGRTAGPLPLG